MDRDTVFPFSAVVGQEQVRLALLLNAVSRQVGGVLIRGRRGTAKSTLARGLAHLLPEMEVVTDCPFSCDPLDIEALCESCVDKLATEGTLPTSRNRMKLVTLPLNATEEMVVGTLDIEKALRHGEKGFEPGILAKANRSILYVDEVNLLEDHIVDILLDSAAMGLNIVEREGVSFRHGARFILVGTMNPEEGDLRPQLEDRFGLCADVDVRTTAEQRSEILRRNLQFSRNPLEFESQWHSAQEELRSSLLAARELYPRVDVPDKLLDLVAAIVDRSGADGHRADLAMLHAGRALAALEECDRVTTEHLARVAVLSLGHRLPRGGPGGKKAELPDITALVDTVLKEQAGDDAPGKGCFEAGNGEKGQKEAMPSPAPLESSPGSQFDEVKLPDGANASAGGRRGSVRVQDSRGRYCRSVAPNDHRSPASPGDIAIDATIRSSVLRGGGEDGKPQILPGDLKVKVRTRKCGASIVFVVDASASMGVSKRLEASRDAILSLLVDTYKKRDRVGLVVFKDDSAELVLSPTSSTVLARRLLSELKPGGTTPLSHGLALGYRVLSREMSRTPQPAPFLVLISDCGGNVTIGSGDPMSEALQLAGEIREKGINSVILDSAPARPSVKDGGRRPSAARKIADAMGSSYFPLRNMDKETIISRVSQSAGMLLESQPQASRR